MLHETKSLIAELRGVAAELWAAPTWRRAALFLFPYAGVLVGLSVAAHYGEVTDARLPREFFFATDGGFGEWLEYPLTFSVAAMLFLMWRAHRTLAYLANAVLFLWLTFDNALELHEKFGHAAARAFPGRALPVAPNDIGEAALFAVVGLFWLIALGLSLRTARIRAAAHSLILAACVGGAAFFGVIVDLIVVWGEHGRASIEIETFIEDGGEFAMLCLSFLVAVSIFDIERARSRQP